MGVYIIAEAGVNHNGDLMLAKKLVDMAKDAGADAIKFQTFKAEESTGSYAVKAAYQQSNDPTQESQLDMIRRLELPFEQFREIQAYCKEKGITFISTPDGSESLQFLVSLGVPFIKIGSTEVTNLPFLREIADTHLPMILSTGMSTLGEVERAVQTIRARSDARFGLMHCTTDYPTRVEEVNLRAMLSMRDAFHIEVGLSDHTLGCEAAIAATALGAVFIEKHITLDRNMPGPDHAASMPPEEFRAYVRSIRATESLLGDGIKRPTQHELEIMPQVRRSLLAATDLPAGTVLTPEAMVCKRPGTGIAPEYADIVTGRILKRALAKEEPIHWEDI